jgi:hypothetical protein
VLAFLTWFTEKGPSYDATAHGMDARLAAYLADRACSEWQRHTSSGDGWGLFATAADPGEWRWRQVARDESLTVISIGLPVGLAPGLLARGPVELARLSIGDTGVLSDVVPPFGLVVVDEASKGFSSAKTGWAWRACTPTGPRASWHSRTCRRCFPTSSATR